MKSWHRNSARKKAFTLLELLIVIGIIVVLASITVPAIKGLTKSNDNGQSVNLVRAMLSSARAIAVAQHRQAGVVFFEETSTYSLPVNSSQTAMQVFVEDYNQAQYTQFAPNVHQGNTIFVAYSTTRQYLPAGIRIAALNDGGGLLTGDNGNTFAGKSRAIVFDADGNMVTRNGLATPFLQGVSALGLPGTYPQASGDWKFACRNAPAGTSPGSDLSNPSVGISSPGFFVFSMTDYAAQNFASGSAGDGARTAWIRANATPIIVNANTGMLIR